MKRLVLLALLTLPLPALAQSYVPPKAEFTLVKAPPALSKFIDEVRDTAQAESGPEQAKHLAGLFADEVDLLGQEPLRLTKPSLSALAQFMAMEAPDAKLSAEAQAQDAVWRFLASELDVPSPLGTTPTRAGRICRGPQVTMNEAGLKGARAKQEAESARAVATAKAIAVHVGPADSAKDKRVIGNLPAKVGIIYLQNAGNGGINNAKIVMPDGKIGYVDETSLVATGAPALCFSLINGAWKIDGFRKANQP